MPTHTVAQGETLTRIAKQYKLGSWQTIYNHPQNASFKALRGNPDIIYPGDKVFIPDPESTPHKIQTNTRTVFKVPSLKEHLRLKLQDSSGQARANTAVKLQIGDTTYNLQSDTNGKIEVELPEESGADAELYVFADDGEEIENRFSLKLGYLDPVSTISGVQARCNALGFDCGKVDGIRGNQTIAGVKAFQAAHGLDVDGVAGPITQAKLIETYSC